MKKLLCIVLVLCTLFCPALRISAVTDNSSNQTTAEEFANNVGALITANTASKSMPGKDINAGYGEYTEFETARLIVKCKQKINILNAVSVISGYNDLWVLQFETAKDAAEAFEYYSSRSGIEFVEADKEVCACTMSAVQPLIETDYNREHLSWGPLHIGIDKFYNSVTAGNFTLHQTVIGVIDTGVDPNHPYLKGKIIPTKINTSSSGIRNDSMDDCGHGTQVAGVIADTTLDSVYIKPYKVLNSQGGGTVITLAAGINCAVNDGVDVINISIGFEEDSEVLKAAIDNAERNDITVIAAAGNDASNTVYYPASYPSVIKVTAVNDSNVIANFSTVGTDVDFAAPGVDIRTTTLNNEYTVVKGTSFAAPSVSAVAACILSAQPNASSEDIKDILTTCALKVSDYNADQKYGNGVVNFPFLEDTALSSAKTDTPYFSKETALYNKEIELEIFCDTPDSVIYYTTDRSAPTKTNPSSKIYDGTPLQLSQTTIIMAVAYSEGNYRSAIATFNAIIAPTASENELIVDSSGNLLSYTGSNVSITIPSAVNGITVTGVGEKAFADSDIYEIIFPPTVTEIKSGAFENCTDLKTVGAFKATVIGDKAFYNCINLRNIYLGELTAIGKYSFYNVCSHQYYLSERTFSLNLQKLKTLPEGAFMNSALSVAEFNRISDIGKNVFAECTSLVSVYFNSMGSMPDGMFKGCSSLVDVDIYNTNYVSIGAFSTCVNLISVNIPQASYVDSNAFENCISLASVTLSRAETVHSNAFTGCTALRTLNLPSMLEFEPEVYAENGPRITLPNRLETFSAPKIAKTVSDMFNSCRNTIKNIYLNSTADIVENTFRGCHNVFFLNIENVSQIEENAFAYCTIQFIDARSLETTADLPDNSGILLSNNFIESTDNADNLTVYGTSNTFVERYANHKGYAFVPIPLIFNDIPEYVTENSETVFINAVGFNLTYQWYWNTVNSTENGTPIEGATTNSYTFTESDTAPFYYCVITQRDMETVSVITTHVIIKDTTPADYTAYNEAVSKAKEIDRSLYENLYILDSALEVDVSDRYSCEQEIVDSQAEAILQAIASLKYKTVESFILYTFKNNLNVFEITKVIPAIYPEDSVYEGVEWSSSDSNILMVSENGYVGCVGNGTATVYAKIINPDGTEQIRETTFVSDLSLINRLIAFLFKPLFTFWFNLYY